MIPDELRRFVLTSIPSIPHLEAALLFHASPDIELTAGEVARSLYLPESKTAELLEALCAAGILAARGETQPRYRFAPCEETLAQSIDSLAAAYSADMIAITRLIHDATGKSAHRFAEAFKLRKDR